MGSKTTFLLQMKIGGQIPRDKVVNLFLKWVVSLDRTQMVSLSGFSKLFTKQPKYLLNDITSEINQHFGLNTTPH